MARSVITILATVAVLAACHGLDRGEDAVLPPQLEGRLLLVEGRNDLARGIQVRRQDNDLIATADHRHTGIIRWLIYERDETGQDYGVYALGLAKNPIQVPLPLTTESARWPGTGPEQALERLIATVVGNEEATALVGRHRERWLRPGLRAFFLLPKSAADESVGNQNRNTATIYIMEL